MFSCTRSALRALCALLITVLLAACGDDDGGLSVDDLTGSHDVPRGTAAPSTDGDNGGLTPDNGGTTPDNGGTTPDDGGTTPDDGGTTPDDGGTTPDDGGTTPDDGGDPTPGDDLIEPGGLCGCDADCADADGHDGICVYGVCMTRASADCASGGSTDECAGGSRCWFLSQQPGPICWPDCDSYTCDGACDGDGSCVMTDETDCTAACGSYCSPDDPVDDPVDDPIDDPAGGGPIGTTCSADADCGGAAYCIPEEDGNGWLDGYCFGWDCPTPGAACDGGGVCVAELGGDGVNTCMQPCEAGCRDGYQCLVFNDETFCYPYCETNNECPTSYACSDNACVPGSPCSPSAPDGYCEVGQVCDDGSCTDECSAEATSGFCPDGFTCDGGDCVSISGCGTWECTGASCANLVPFPGSYDINDAQARAAGYFISTQPKYAYFRGDLVELFTWAACEMRAAFPGVGPVAFNDMSQSNGLTPGTDTGSPRHPTSTHRGADVDVAYYQTDGANNYQIICGDGSDRNGNGYAGTYNDGYFCTTEANIVAVQQQGWFMALLAQHPDWRVVGIDATLADDLYNETQRLYSDGLITATVRDRMNVLGYGADGGWSFHHHHLHFSFQ